MTDLMQKILNNKNLKDYLKYAVIGIFCYSVILLLLLYSPTQSQKLPERIANPYYEGNWEANLKKYYKCIEKPNKEIKVWGDKLLYAITYNQFELEARNKLRELEDEIDLCLRVYNSRQNRNLEYWEVGKDVTAERAAEILEVGKDEILWRQENYEECFAEELFKEGGDVSKCD